MIAKNDTCPVAAFANAAEKFYGVQFHPEVQHSVHESVLKNFAFGVCGCSGDWSRIANFIEIETKKIRETVGDKKVLLGLSGRVDSSVVGVLLHKAIGSQLTCIFVDHGLLRKGEGDQVMESLVGKFGLNIIRVDAKKRFMDKLAGVSDPEQKRKIIGNEFVYVFDDEATKLQGIDFLAQGTLYTDVIESGTETAQTIKSHHNVGGLPEDMQFKLIEPLNTLFKDEVRELGTQLGMPGKASFGVSHSQALVWESASSAKSPKKNWKSSANQTTSCAKKSRMLVWNATYGNTSLSFQASAA